MRTTAARVELRYTVRMPEDGWICPEGPVEESSEWVCPEGPVPESIAHNIAVHRLYSVLVFWASRTETPSFVARNLAVRWMEEQPRVGIDPDVCVLQPPPPEAMSLRSLCLWKPGHVAPAISFEVVSANHPLKDYVAIHERYAAFGARELVVFDPLLAGPKSLGGPISLQVWRHDGLVFERGYAGPGPVFSEVLGAWLIVEDGLLHVASDERGMERWPAEQDYERAEKERAIAEKERAIAEKERAVAEKERAVAERERAIAEKEHERAERDREHAARLDVERRLAELEARLAAPPSDEG